MGDLINGYQITTAFTNSNAGMCHWAFAQKDGNDYFIKQLLFPKYPTSAAEEKLAPAIVNAMKVEATEFYSQRKLFYDKLHECRTGNNVVVQDFFRANEFYYIVTERIHGPFLSIEHISRLSDEKKRTLLKAILYSVMQIHDRGIVHSDLKPENIQIVGDQRYFSPEAVLRNDERDVPVGVSSDMFALGLLFHQYWCGEFPAFNRAEYDSASIALLNHSNLILSPLLPSDIRSLIDGMLSKYQEGRPSAREAWELLSPGSFRVPTDEDLGFHVPFDCDL